MSSILKGIQLNEVNPNNYDSDWDYQDAVARSGRSRSRSSDSYDAHDAENDAYEMHKRFAATRARKEAEAKAAAEKAKTEKLDELSPKTLASYKKKAGADATASDNRGDYARGNKRMSGIMQATKKEFANDAKGVAEVTGDKPFDSMMKNISKGTNKQKTLDRKEQQKQTQQRARDAFGNMFGGGNPADQLKIREQGVAEGSEEDSYSNKFVQSQIDYYKKHLLSGNTGDQHRIRGSLMNYERIKNQRIKNNTWQEQGVAEGLDDNRVSFKVQKGKNKFATTLSVGVNPVGVYQYDADTGRSVAEVYPEFKGKGLGKLLVLHAIYTAAKLGLDFQEDESRTSEYDNVLDSLSSNGYIVDDDGYWYVTGEGEQYLQHSLKQGVAEAQHSCPHCGGEMVNEELMNEKKDACYYKVKSRYSVWPSAYASGALVKCRKKGASNWGNGGKKNESSILEGIEQADESLHDWFSKEKWVRMDTKGNIKGPCAREPGEGKPKCLPQSKAHSLGKKGRASAAQRKRREDPNPDRHGSAINVNTKKKSNENIGEGWKENLGAATLAGAMAFGGAGHAQAADLSGYNTQYLQQVAQGNHPRPMVSVADAKAELQARMSANPVSGKTPEEAMRDPRYKSDPMFKAEVDRAASIGSAPQAEAPKGFSMEYLQKAADPNRFGRYLISIEKAQELLKQAQNK